MKSKFACLLFSILSVISFSSAAAESWSYKKNLKADHENMCISPTGQPVGGWYSCHVDGTCKNPEAIANQCKARFDKKASPSDGGDLMLVKARLEQTMKTHSITGSTAECLKHPECKAAIDAAAAYLAVDPKVITTMTTPISAEWKGEKGDYHYLLPAGYQYCRAKIETLSIVPKDGDESAYMTVTGSDHDLRIQAWAPQSGLYAGKTWVEADISLVGVKDSLVQEYRSKGICTDKYISKFCRGGDRYHKGSPPCNLIKD